MTFVADASALLAVLLREPDADWYRAKLDQAEVIWLSPVNWFEVQARIIRLQGDEGTAEATTWLEGLGIQIEPITKDQASIAFVALTKYRDRPAKLNLGDCFAYALAKTKGVPLLYKGDDFKATDLTSA